jgi:hypothetical protein
MSEAATLLMAAFSFVLAAFFLVASVVSKVAMTRILGFWYAVVFNNVGFFLLVAHCVTYC